MSSILTSSFDENQPEIYPANQSTCGVCKSVSSKYTCPRCNLPYCSLACFKHQKHSSCSESFYKESLENELRNSKASEEEKARIIEMLHDIEIDSETEEAPSLEQRLGGTDLDKMNQEEVWSKLTKAEQNEFSTAVRSGNCSHLLEPWIPWWTYHSVYLETFIDGEDPQPKNPDVHGLKGKMPQDQIDIPKLDALLQGKEASPLVRNNLVDVLYTYAFFCRRYNGCHKELFDEFSVFVIKSSAFLEKGQSYGSCMEVLCIAEERCSTPQGGAVDQKTLVGSMFDVFHLLQGQDMNNQCMYVVPALSELHCILSKFRKAYKKKRERYDISHNLIFQAMKKLEFLLSWSVKHKMELCGLALKVLMAYKKRKIKSRTQRKMERTADKLRREMLVERQKENKPLIEELEK